MVNGSERTTTVLDARKPESRAKALAHFCAKLPAFAENDTLKLQLVEKMEKAGAEWHDYDPAEKPAKDTQPLPFDEVAPAKEEVDLSELLYDLTATIQRFIVLPDGAVEAVALWIAHTWCFEVFDFTPRLVICSPVMGCGKTSLLDAARGAGRRAIAAENTTTAALFRAIAEWRPTVILDEADNLLLPKTADPELRGILNAGFRRGASVVRCVGEDNVPTPFDVFAPVAFGLIGKLPGTLMDRSIVVNMRRKTATEFVERSRPKKMEPEFNALRPRFARWSKDNSEDLGVAEPALPEELGDRAQDMWEPLLAIADAAGESWPDLARIAAVELSAGTIEDGAAGLMVLQDIREVFQTKAVEKLTTKELLAALVALEERPWSTWSRNDKPLTDRKLAGLLEPFSVRSRDIRQPRGSVLKGYLLEEFADAFSRYLDPDPLQPLQP